MVFPLEIEASGRDGHEPAPARRYRYRDGAGDIGVIASVTEPFCESCGTWCEARKGVATSAEEAVKQADNLIKTGNTGAKSEKQLFDCLLITKDNIDKYDF